jgi:hypothetical protein
MVEPLMVCPAVATQADVEQANVVADAAVAAVERHVQAAESEDWLGEIADEANAQDNAIGEGDFKRGQRFKRLHATLSNPQVLLALCVADGSAMSTAREVAGTSPADAYSVSLVVNTFAGATSCCPVPQPSLPDGCHYRGSADGCVHCHAHPFGPGGV